MSRSIAALFQRLTQGVYVVGVAHGAVRNAFTAAWVLLAIASRGLIKFEKRTSLMADGSSGHSEGVSGVGSAALVPNNEQNAPFAMQ